MDFNTSVSNEHSSVSFDISDDSENLMVFFGGIAGNALILGIPPFEFLRLSGDLKIKKFFIRDNRQCWYQKGLVGICDDFEGIIKFLKKALNDIGPKRVVFLGNSAGGFAALILGRLLNVDKVVCFSPQTFVSRSKRLMYFDYRWIRQVGEIYKKKDLNKSYIDVKKVFDTTDNDKTVYEIHFCSKHRLDNMHAKRLAKFKNVQLIGYDYGGHGLIKDLKENTKLHKIILDAVSFKDADA